MTNKERNEINLKVKKIVREWRRRIKSGVRRVKRNKNIIK